MSTDINAQIELSQVDDVSIHLPEKILHPWYTSLIENPVNDNEILVIGSGENRSDILIYNKRRKRFVKNKVDLTLLKNNRRKIEVGYIYKTQAVRSKRNEDYIVVAISCAMHASLHYSIFDCKTYKWVNFDQYSNCINKFDVAKGVNDDSAHVEYNDASTMIAVENYLIFTGCGQFYNNIDIIDVHDEMKPIRIHSSRMNNAFKYHACVQLANKLKSNNNTNIRLLLFGGEYLHFSNSIYQLEITLKLLKKVDRSQEYPIIMTKKLDSNDENFIGIRDKYTDLHGKNIEIKIEYNSVAWKCSEINSNNNDTAMFRKKWQAVTYVWQNQLSDLVLSSNTNYHKILSKLSLKNNNLNKLGKEDCKHLAVFGGGYLDGDAPQHIAILDTDTLEWCVSKYRLPSTSQDDTIINSVIDEKGFIYVLNDDCICRFDGGLGMQQFKEMFSEMEDNNAYVTSLFKEVFHLGHKHKFFKWKYILDEKLTDTDPASLFKKDLSKEDWVIRPVLSSIWSIVKDAYHENAVLTVGTISKWITRDDLIQNIHFLFEDVQWRVIDIYTLEKFVRNFHKIDEFDKDESAILHNACQYNNAIALRYMMNNKICTESNINMKNKISNRTCLDAALMNDNDECVEILINEFGYGSASILSDIETANVQVNGLASRKLDVLKIYHENGINWNVKDEKGLYIIDHILKHENNEALAYIIQRGIYSISKCIEIIQSEDFEYNETRCIQMLCDMIDNSVDCSVDYSILQCAVTHDADKILESLLRLKLKQQGITDIKRYRENEVISFEFMLNLLKLCINGDKKCGELVKGWLRTITEYHCESVTCDHNLSQTDIDEHNDSMCILCLESVTMDDYDYCVYCNYLDFLCRKGNQNLHVIHRLWQGAFENGNGFFHSTFWNFVEGNRIGMMQYIAENPSNVDKFDQAEWSCLHTIAYAIHPNLLTDSYKATRKQLDTLKQLFTQNHNYNDLFKFSFDGNLPIHLACQTNNSLILKIIIQVANAKFPKQQCNQMLNQVKKDKYWNYTPLMIAIRNNSIDCVQILCQNDSVVNGILKHKSRYPSYNSFEFACYYNNVDILKIFCRRCDSQELILTENLQRMINIANYGSLKRCLGNACVDFLSEISKNPTTTQSNKSLTDLILVNDNDHNKIGAVCCHNHELPRANTFTSKKCDICQEKGTTWRSCVKCQSKDDPKLFPSIICEKCVAATQVWSTIVHTPQNASVNQEIQQNIFQFIKPEIVNRVEFGDTYMCSMLCCSSLSGLYSEKIHFVVCLNRFIHWKTALASIC